MKRPRWFQQIRASLGGYFWLPCVLCGKKFGGHEWGTGQGISSVPTEQRFVSQGICPDCQTAGRGRHGSWRHSRPLVAR